MPPPVSPFPETQSERDRWILDRRGPREPTDPTRPAAFLLEHERFATGEVGAVATLFLTNRECPWRCTMCDLWRHTLPHSVALGDIPQQIAFALQNLPPARQVKLYNSGSFFDRGAIPPEDFGAIAALVRRFERVVVESHPSLIGSSALHLRDLLLPAQLEVAMGLETANPAVLEKLNKRMTLDGYAAAAHLLREAGIALRSFVLVQPPFMAPSEALGWACRSIDFAQGCGATVVSLIPTRPGNGATDHLALAGDFTPPTLPTLEGALAYGITRSRGRVFLDLWDTDRLAGCPACKPARLARLRSCNLTQTVLPPIPCKLCGGSQ